MGNRLFGFAAGLLLLAGIAINPSTMVRRETVAEAVLRSTVEVNAVIDGSLAVGSGVLYKSGNDVFVLTAAHVIGDGKGIYMVSQSNPNDESEREVWMADVVAYENQSDWAILRPVGDTRRIGVGTTFVSLPPRVGNGVYAAGSPLGEDNTITEGIVANRKRSVEWNADHHLVVTCNGGSGLSGGGVYDIHTGGCIGIVVRLNRAANLLYVVPIQTILNDLKDSGRQSLLQP